MGFNLGKNLWRGVKVLAVLILVGIIGGLITGVLKAFGVVVDNIVVIAVLGIIGLVIILLILGAIFGNKGIRTFIK